MRKFILTLSARVSAHTRDNVPKEKSLAALLDDAPVNALARTYLGKDFAFSTPKKEPYT